MCVPPITCISNEPLYIANMASNTFASLYYIDHEIDHDKIALKKADKDTSYKLFVLFKAYIYNDRQTLVAPATISS